MDLQTSPVNEILYVNFNQDYTCFVVGTTNGFRVYSTDPFRLTHRRDFENGGGLGVVSMLFRTNILALVGGGANPRFQPHKVVLWDDQDARVIAELSFRTPVKAVRLRRDVVVVVCLNKIYVYGFRNLGSLDSIETTANPRGLCCLSVGTDRVVLISPGMQIGQVLVIFYPKSFGGDLSAPVMREKTTLITAHESAIASMSTDYSGAFLATASEKGTIIRVYNTASGAKFRQLRRGADRAEIHSLIFSPTGDFLAVASDKGTVHIFAISRPDSSGALNSSGDRGAITAAMTSSTLTSTLGRGHSGLGIGGGNSASIPSSAAAAAPTVVPNNATSSFQVLKRVLPEYFSSEWSFAQFRVPDYRCIAAFGAEPNTVVVICANGSFYKATFDPVRGGEMTRAEFVQFDDASVNGTVANTTAEPPSTAPVPQEEVAEEAEMVRQLSNATVNVSIDDEGALAKAGHAPDATVDTSEPAPAMTPYEVRQPQESPLPASESGYNT